MLWYWFSDTVLQMYRVKSLLSSSSYFPIGLVPVISAVMCTVIWNKVVERHKHKWISLFLWIFRNRQVKVKDNYELKSTIYDRNTIRLKIQLKMHTLSKTWGRKMKNLIWHKKQFKSYNLFWWEQVALKILFSLF